MKTYKKILLSLFLFMCVLFIKTNVFASFDFTFEGVDYSLADLPFDTTLHPHFFIVKNVGKTYSYQVAYPASSYDLPYIYYSTGDPSGIRYNIAGSTTKGQWKYHNYTSGSWSTVKTTSANTISYNANGRQEGYAIYSTVDIYDTNGNIFFPSSVDEYIFPYIADTDEVLSNLDNFDDILIFPGSLSKSYLPLKFGIYKYIDPVSDFEVVFEITLDTSSPYYLYIIENPSDYWWEIPTDLFKKLLINGEDYRFTIFGTNQDGDFTIPRPITYQGTTYIPPTDEQLQTDAIKDQTEKIEEQTDAIKEQTEVNKSIFARIGEILSYINPLSENFFAYKLVGILVDALKSLFVPEDRIFRNIF